MKLTTTDTQHLQLPELLGELQRIENQLYALCKVGNENALGATPAIFLDLTDFGIRVFNLFKTNVFKFWKPIKRSELRLFTENKRASISAVEAKPYDTYKDKAILFPSGLNATYLEGVTELQKDYLLIGIKSRLESFEKDLKRFRVAVANNTYSDTFFKPMAAGNAKFEVTLTEINNALDKLFSKKDQYRIADRTVLFSTAFKSMRELTMSRNGLLEIEPYLSESYSLVNTNDNLVKLLTDIRELGDKADPHVLRDLAVMVRTLAVAIDLHSRLITHQLQMEHSLVVTYSDVLFRGL